MAKKIKLPPLKPKPRASAPVELYAKPSPKMTRLKRGKVLTAAEKAAFLAARPDLKKPD